MKNVTLMVGKWKQGTCVTFTLFTYVFLLFDMCISNFEYDVLQCKLIYDI